MTTIRAFVFFILSRSSRGIFFGDDCAALLANKVAIFVSFEVAVFVATVNACVDGGAVLKYGRSGESRTLVTASHIYSYLALVIDDRPAIFTDVVSFFVTFKIFVVMAAVRTMDVLRECAEERRNSVESVEGWPGS